MGWRIGSSAPFCWREFQLGAAEIGHIHPGAEFWIFLFHALFVMRLLGGRSCERAPLGFQFRLDYLSHPHGGELSARALAAASLLPSLPLKSASFARNLFHPAGLRIETTARQDSSKAPLFWLKQGPLHLVFVR